MREAHRVLRPERWLAAAAISRFASDHDGLVHGFLLQPEFAAVAFAGLATGRHISSARQSEWFTSAYFHRPDELASEVARAGLDAVSVFGIEGLAGWLPDLDDRLADPVDRALILDVLERTEAEPSIVGVSAHFLALGRTPSNVGDAVSTGKGGLMPGWSVSLGWQDSPGLQARAVAIDGGRCPYLCIGS